MGDVWHRIGDHPDVCRKEIREAHLTEVQDTHGNRIVITYDCETRNVGSSPCSYVHGIRPSHIEYFANGESLATARIVLNYAADRQDQEIEGKASGAQVYFTAYRLTSVDVQVRTGTGANDYTTARTYTLGHDYDRHLRLRSVQELGRETSVCSTSAVKR